MVNVGTNFENMLWSLCLPTDPWHSHTLGAAIEASEERVRNAGVIVEFIPPNGLEGTVAPSMSTSCGVGGASSAVPGRVIRLPKLIDLAISQAIDYGRVSETDIGLRSNDATAVVEGNVVALYVANSKAFVYMNGKDVKHLHSADAKLPLSLEWGRFLVVSAGPDRSVAFYNPIHRRFLAAAEDEGFEASACQASHADDHPRAAESFHPGPWNAPNKGIRFRNHLRHRSYYLEVVQVRGFDF